MIFEDLCRGRSILSPHNAPNGPTLVRWDYMRPPSADNVIPMNQPYADKHIRRCHDLKEKPGAVWGREAMAVYERTREILKDKKWFMEMSRFLLYPTIGQTSNIRSAVFSFYIRRQRRCQCFGVLYERLVSNIGKQISHALRFGCTCHSTLRFPRHMSTSEQHQ